MQPNLTIHGAFTAVAARSPESTAIVGDGNAVTYAELAQRSDHVAQYLRSLGIGEGERVGLYTLRSVDSIVAMLGILKAGAAFIPFDAAYPPALLKFVYEDCAPALMLVQKSLLEQWSGPPFWTGKSATIGTDIEGQFCASGAMQWDLPAVGSEALAYIMYTSGSTGKPKGVRIPHRGVVRLVIDNTFADMDASQVHLQLAPLAFDASTFEIWGALLHGAKLAVVPTPHPSLDDIADAVTRHGVTTLWLTAGLFHLMVDHRLDGLTSLRQLLAGGDVLSPPHVAKALQALPECQLINGYGPTENTTFTCCYRIPRDYAATGPVPIGSAIGHTEVYVLDESGRRVEDMQVGELYAGGRGVALGYLNRPDLTAERFLPDPYTTSGSALMYRTGDRVRRRPDGNLEFLGRFDRQVKINGKRVELDEIEAAIQRSGLVDDAAVTSPPVESGHRKVFAYVKSPRHAASVAAELRGFLKQQLPEHMLPAAIFVLGALPLSPTGKVDRAKLPQPSELDRPADSDARAPDDATETALVTIWCEVLDRKSVGVDDNFFDLGGTSLQLTQVHAKIRSAMHVEITLVDLFQYPRISALAGRLLQRPAAVPAHSAGVLSALDRANRQRAALTRARPSPPRNS
jgi:amino acid adenylation domain-containing protein